jgi:SNF2 family DNA or RNA helicase
VTDQLEPYQVAGAMFLAGRSRASIFDEPGLGKTAQAIRARELTRETAPAIVICPAGVRQVWPYQFSLWGRTGAKVVKADSIFDLTTWQRGKIDVLVMSYEQATTWAPDIREDFFGPLIIDESHYLKNPEAKRTKAIVGDGTGHGGFANMASHVWTLTGTPIKNDPADLWVPLRLARATDLTYTKFQKRFFKQVAGTFSVTNTIRKEMLQELKDLIASMSLMRTFEDVGSQLPPIRLDVLPVDGSSEAIIEAEQSLAFADSTHISTLRALIAEAKAPNYAKLITEELKTGVIDKLVVMGQHRKAIDIVTTHLQQHGINAASITGATSERDRTAAVRSFQDEPNGVRVIVGNIQAAGTGLTLTAACRLDMLESSWTPADNVQAIRRVRRKGQTRPTLARFVMLNDSFDQQVARVVVRKANTTVAITAKDNLQEAMPR